MFCGKHIFFLLITYSAFHNEDHGNCSAFQTKPNALKRKRRYTTLPSSLLLSSSQQQKQTRVYTGPFLPPPIISSSEEVGDDRIEEKLSSSSSSSIITAGIQLVELGLDLCIGQSSVSSGLGLFVRCSDGIDSTTLPECTLLCGYARSGTFQMKDVGDKTVGFTIQGDEVAVFYDRKLMMIGDALKKASVEHYDGNDVSLAGHNVVWDEEGGKIQIHPTMDDNKFARYFVPDLANSDDGGVSAVTTMEGGREGDNLDIQNSGQFCNDLAWGVGGGGDSTSVMQSPPENIDEYETRSVLRNAVQLIWRLAYDDNGCLTPSWPVSVLSSDMTFENQDFMELGTRYGFGYWQATVDLDNL